MCARNRSVHCHTLAQPAKIRVQSQDKMAEWCLGEAFVEAHILLLLVASATNGNCAGRSSISCRVINCSQLRVISRGRQNRTANTHTHTYKHTYKPFSFRCWADEGIAKLAAALSTKRFAARSLAKVVQRPQNATQRNATKKQQQQKTTTKYYRRCGLCNTLNLVFVVVVAFFASLQLFNNRDHDRAPHEHDHRSACVRVFGLCVCIFMQAINDMYSVRYVCMCVCRELERALSIVRSKSALGSRRRASTQHRNQIRPNSRSTGALIFMVVMSAPVQ